VLSHRCSWQLYRTPTSRNCKPLHSVQMVQPGASVRHARTCTAEEELQGMCGIWRNASRAHFFQLPAPVKATGASGLLPSLARFHAAARIDSGPPGGPLQTAGRGVLHLHEAAFLPSSRWQVGNESTVSAAISYRSLDALRSSRLHAPAAI
jgi:hypothetical protein